MKLDKVIVENFRGYKERTELFVDGKLTALIGKNDIGKSTLLEALEIFFNGSSSQQVKIEQCDKNVFSDGFEIKITCIFADFPQSLVIDSSSETSLASEYLLNSCGKLEVQKSYDASLKSLSAKIFLIAYHPCNEGLSDLHSVKQAELKKRIKERKVDEAAIADMRSNVCLRKSLYLTEKLVFEETAIPVNKEDAKAIWDSLSSYLPMFALFRSDRGSNDQDSEVQDPMKLAVSQALLEVRDDLEKIKEKVREYAIGVACRTLDKLKDMDASLADDLIPEFTKEPEWKSIFKLNLSSEQGISINKRGGGVRRLILLNFFRAEAERKHEEGKVPSIIYAIEEPETAQHPSNQEILIEALLKLSERKNCQVILTTHVPALAGLLPLESVRYIERNQESGRVTILHNSDETYQKIADGLGILPDREISTASAFVMVEGYSDVIFLNHLTSVMKESGYILESLSDKNIIPIMTGGCGNLKHWVNLKIIDRLNRPWAVFFDSDDHGHKDNSDYLKKLDELDGYRKKGIYCHLTKKREAENYLCPNVIRKARNVNVVFTDFCDVKDIVNKVTNIRKIQVLEKLWPLMSADDILARDVFLDDDGNEQHELLEVAKVLVSL